MQKQWVRPLNAAKTAQPTTSSIQLFSGRQPTVKMLSQRVSSDLHPWLSGCRKTWVVDCAAATCKTICDSVGLLDYELFKTSGPAQHLTTYGVEKLSLRNSSKVSTKLRCESNLEDRSTRVKGLCSRLWTKNGCHLKAVRLFSRWLQLLVELLMCIIGKL